MNSESKRKMFWILKDESSNRALIRDPADRWPDDVNGEPSAAWVRVIEHSAVDEALAKVVEMERNWNAARDVNKWLSADHTKLKKERDALERRLSEATELIKDATETLMALAGKAEDRGTQRFAWAAANKLDAFITPEEFKSKPQPAGKLTQAKCDCYLDERRSCDVCKGES